MPKTPIRNRTQNTARRFSLGLALAGSLALPTMLAHADDSAKIDKLEQENQDLKKRLEALEAVAKAEGILPDAKSSHVLTKVAGTTISGFVSASYFYDLSNPPSGKSAGYLWGYNKANNFALNKFKLTIASPAVERSGDKWDVGYRASLIFGNDAPIVNSGSSTTGFDNLREAYVEANAPVGTGLNIKVGELISLLNYESGDGGAANDNFSQGYQWFYTGNGPAAGAQVGYVFTDWLDVKVRAQNGLYAGPVDNNSAKTIMGAIGLKPSEKSWISLVGFTGREEPGFNSSIKLAQGGSFLGGWQATEKLHLGTELDYFVFSSGAKSSDVYSFGGWVSYSLTEKLLAAVRAEFLSDTDGAEVGGLNFATAVAGDISSIAFTLNYMPVPNIKIQPEIRYDHISLANGFGNKTDRVIVGAGVSYLF
ncbi:MAG TPA: outer membrane beta-barrel protein [Candidatus Limnocylindria bacterium]|jgi:hypothetical protein|nr:outer membrane beta-barrel protein [Candidatus Limnocylindria bacterium]